MVPSEYYTNINYYTHSTDNTNTKLIIVYLKPNRDKFDFMSQCI